MLRETNTPRSIPNNRKDAAKFRASFQHRVEADEAGKDATACGGIINMPPYNQLTNIHDWEEFLTEEMPPLTSFTISSSRHLPL